MFRMMRYITKYQNNNVLSYKNAISWHTLKYALLLCSGIILLLYPVPFVASQDTASLDELFLDDSVTDDSDSAVQKNDVRDPSPDNTKDNVDGIGSGDTPIDTYLPNKEASIVMNMSIIERFIYRGQTNRTAINRDNLIYISPIANTLLLEQYVQYQNAHRWFGFTLDYRLYFSLQDREKAHKTTEWDLNTYFNYELNTLYLRAALWDQTVRIYAGKLLFGSGSSFLINPSNPLTRRYGTDVAWAKNTTLHSFSTKNPSPSSFIEKGSGKLIGSWMVRATLNLSWLTWQLAYLPKLETGFHEFDRPAHSFLTSVTLTQWDFFIPTMVFFYDGNPFYGFDASVGIGDTITLQFEGNVSFENERMNITKDGEVRPIPREQAYSAYTLDAASDKGVYVEGIAGITYTPVYESKSLFSILFEVYYNGKGLYNNDWNTYINAAKNIHTIYNALYGDTHARAMATAYKGILGKQLSYYNPLRVRPLYMLLRIYRDDIFETIWTERFNAATGIVYSPFDTTFSWDAELEWTNRKSLTIGTKLQSFFGLANGAFTELTNNILVHIYTEIHF